MSSDDSVVVEGWFSRPSADMVRGLVENAVCVWVAAEIPPDGASPFDFLRFAWVLNVERRLLVERHACRRCWNSNPRYTLYVVWEAGYSESSNRICELCLAGRVVKGEESLQFGPKPSELQRELKIHMVFTREDVLRPGGANLNEVHCNDEGSKWRMFRKLLHRLRKIVSQWENHD
jgi:hypothetical protein